MIRRWSSRTAAFVAATLVVGACQQELPVAIEDQDLPGEPVTVEVTIPWSQFASNLEVFGGYGSPEDLGRGVLANQFDGTLDARTLMRFSGFPEAATVRDSTGAQRPDSSLTIVSGRLVAFMDTIASTNTGPVTLALGATNVEWDATTTTWDFTIDTINDQRSWPTPGAGPVTPVATTVWDPAMGDTAVFMLDSAQVVEWEDPGDLTKGARIDVVDTGSRLQITGTAIRLTVRPSLDPDTLLELNSLGKDLTFVYSPFPNPPPDGIRIGGAPSWRTVLDVAIPAQLNGPPSFCAVVSCPHTLEPGQVSFAALVLTSRATDPGFQPSDSIRLDVRPVFDRSAMPKSPLGTSLIDNILGRAVSPDAFSTAPGEAIEVPFTSFARALIRGTDDVGNPAPNSLALLSVFEPFSISFASFDGPGSAGEPVLRLVLTIGPPVELP